MDNDRSERDRREQARHRFTVLGVYPTGHGIEPVEVGPAELHATCGEIMRSGAMPVIVGYRKIDIAPAETDTAADASQSESEAPAAAPAAPVDVSAAIDAFAADLKRRLTANGGTAPSGLPFTLEP